MPYTIGDALNDPDIEVVEQDDERGDYIIRIGVLTTPVHIELGRWRTSETTNFRISHSMYTSSQLGPYHPSRTWADYWAYALHMAVSSLTEHYRRAVKDGHKPKEGWLIPNKL